MKKSSIMVVMLFLLSGFCHAEVYSVNDMIEHFNLVESEVKQFHVEDCNKIPWLQKGLCDEITEKVISRLAEISPYIGDNALIKRDYWSGEKRFGSKIYVTKTDIHLRVNGETSISFNDNGLAIDDIFYPYIGRFYLSSGVVGDGDGYVKNKICIVPKPFGGCFKHVTKKDNFDIDFSGSAEFDIIAGLTTNAKVIETPDEYILVLQPFFRLVARNSTVDIDYDVNGIGPFTVISSLINVGNAAFDMSIDLATFNFDSAISELVPMSEDTAILLVASTVQADDLAYGAVSRTASEITTYFADDYLDRETSRVLYQQEKIVNNTIKEKLNLDENGLVAFHFSKSKIHGQSMAELIPAFALLM